jgi:hypothetical protein
MPVFALGTFQTMSQYLTEHAVTLIDRLSLLQSICGLDCNFIHHGKQKQSSSIQTYFHNDTLDQS